MKSVHIYLNFPGNTEEAFNFYRSVFGGEFVMIMRYGEMEGSDNMPEDVKNKITHISLPMTPEMILMGTDAIDGFGSPLKQGNDTHIMIATESRAEADKLFNSLSEGGNVEMPIQDMFWGAYYGSFTDKFGANWMISFDENH